MKKLFCDICEAPVERFSDRNLESFIEIGQPFERCVVGSTGFEKVTCRITAKVVFGFERHPTGFGGSPDLCPSCMAKLAGDIHQKLRKVEEVG
jgi:hypothetical protein